ncbi:MAG: non-heme iron oxygenase ferredoxin subunit [Chloroflexota bacterium]
MVVSEWVRVADLSHLAATNVVRVEISGVPVAVWNVRGEFYATADTCTHEEASLAEGDLWDEVIECPLHGAQFDVTSGKVLCLPAIFSLDTYPVKVEDDGVYVGWGTVSSD